MILKPIMDTNIDQSTFGNEMLMIDNGERSRVFRDNEYAVQFICEQFVLKFGRYCPLCNESMKFEKRTVAVNGFVLRCINNKCRKILPLLYGTCFASSCIKIADLLYINYKRLKFLHFLIY